MVNDKEERLRNKMESMAEDAGISVAKAIQQLREQAIRHGAIGDSRERVAVAEAISNVCVDAWRRMSKLMIQRGQKDENLLRGGGKQMITGLLNDHKVSLFGNPAFDPNTKAIRIQDEPKLLDALNKKLDSVINDMHDNTVGDEQVVIASLGNNSRKVFWSWQSDLPGKISRHFIRDALDDAVKSLGSSADVEDAERGDEGRAKGTLELEIDQDRQGVPGSPDLARIRLEKINNSGAFVADVTPVGEVKVKTTGAKAKVLINSNVAIELGYALATATDLRMLMVLNTHYGLRDDLPFDLKHKAGPIEYRLSPEASKDEIIAEQKSLASKFKTALRGIFSASTPAAVVVAFTPQPQAVGNPARFFEADAKLVSAEPKLKPPSEPLLYLRVMPTKQMIPLGRAEAIDTLRNSLPLLNATVIGSANGQNEWGSISYLSHSQRKEVQSATQLFLSREFWAFDSHYLRLEKPSGRLIPTLAVEQAFAKVLSQYLKFAKEKLDVEFPIAIEVGAYPVNGYRFPLGSSDLDDVGLIHMDHVVWRGQVTDLRPATVDDVLLQIFQKFFDAAGERRPVGLYNFPGPSPGSIPHK